MEVWEEAPLGSREDQETRVTPGHFTAQSSWHAARSVPGAAVGNCVCRRSRAARGVIASATDDELGLVPCEAAYRVGIPEAQTFRARPASARRDETERITVVNV